MSINAHRVRGVVSARVRVIALLEQDVIILQVHASAHLDGEDPCVHCHVNLVFSEKIVPRNVLAKTEHSVVCTQVDVFVLTAGKEKIVPNPVDLVCSDRRVL